jgi:PAS domain S-box-containing protein
MWISLKKQLWRWRGVLVTAPTVAGGLLILRLTGVLQFMELVALDQMFRLRPVEPPDPRIVLVTIDESDIQQLGRWPMSDAVLARVITSIQQQKPSAIGLDIFRDLPVEPGHSELVRVFNSTPNLIGIENIIKTAKGEAIQPSPVLKQRKQVAASDLVLDTDNRIRRSLLYLRDHDNQAIFTLGAKLAFAYLEDQGINREPLNPEQTRFRLGRAVFTGLQPDDGGYVRVDAGGYQILSNFPKGQADFRRISITEVLQGRMQRDVLRDRIVLIGITAESLEDRFFTSYTTDTISAPAGVEVHALLTSQLLRAALDGRPLLNVWADPLEWLWIVAWSTIGAVIGWTASSPRKVVIPVVLLGIMICCIAYGLFLIGLWLVLVPSLLGLVGAAIASNFYLMWGNLKEYARTLEQKVAERTLTLQQEIIERQQAESALVGSEARFRHLAGAAVEAIVITEQDRITDVNEAFIQLFGYSHTEAIAIAATDLVTPEYRESVVQNNQTEAACEIVCLRKDSITFPAEVQTRVTTYDEQTIRIASIRDISDRKRAEEASILEERNRMAREIHDTLAQSFTGILVQIGAAMQVLSDDAEATQAHLEIIDELARIGLAEARRSVTALRPQLLEDGDLHSALHCLVTQMRATADTTLIYEITGRAYPLSVEVENNLFRIGQEALTNAIKYANANEIRVELAYKATQCSLHIRDDGIGFGVGIIPSIGGFGLLGISERAERIGAQLTIYSQPGQGTEIIVIVNQLGEIS